jgi:putative Ca2+/H+ antiporter (TMEM165/GDT1 family)
MEPFINSFLLIFASEMGDKTQLLALVLTARFKKPWTIMAGIFVATLLNHALATGFGNYVSSFMNPETLRWVLALLFFGFGLWLLIPDKEEELSTERKSGAFLTTLITFFIAEMGDKTQLATIALGARYSQTVLVTFATTLGMMASNGFVVFLGDKILKKIKMSWVRLFACLLFIFFGLGILFYS